jgi:hypothetical protein
MLVTSLFDRMAISHHHLHYPGQESEAGLCHGVSVEADPQLYGLPLREISSVLRVRVTCNRKTPNTK